MAQASHYNGVRDGSSPIDSFGPRAYWAHSQKRPRQISGPALTRLLRLQCSRNPMPPGPAPRLGSDLVKCNWLAPVTEVEFLQTRPERTCQCETWRSGQCWVDKSNLRVHPACPGYRVCLPDGQRHGCAGEDTGYYAGEIFGETLTIYYF